MSFITNPSNDGDSVDLSGLVPKTCTINKKPLKNDVVLDLEDFPNVQKSISDIEVGSNIEGGQYSELFYIKGNGEAIYEIKENVTFIHVVMSLNYKDVNTDVRLYVKSGESTLFTQMYIVRLEELSFWMPVGNNATSVKFLVGNKNSNPIQTTRIAISDVLVKG